MTDAFQGIPNVHPQAAEALRDMEQFRDALSDQLHQVTTGAFTGTDEDATVQVTVNGTRWLTGLHVEDGLLRLGAETVQDRINEALANAQAAASEAFAAQQAQLYANLTGLTTSLRTGLGLG
jgi:DNA-binding protein YbaB